MRLDGRDVFFLTGTDEHGLKMRQTASREGLTPRELSDRNVLRFREMIRKLNCSNDAFIRTTEERHYRASAAIWERMSKARDIYLSKYSGWYSVRDEAYYTEDETTVGQDSVRYGPTGSPVEWVEEDSYFFRLSAYQDRLLELYAKYPDFVLPESRMNEVASFVRRGLQDLSISRTTFDWGVPVPGDPKHVMYVWVDALTNYITGVGFPNTNSWEFRRYWPANLHVIGKDIVRFHAVYWPAFLMSAGLQLPKRIFSHGFLFNRGEKMSKSVGNVVDPIELANEYGVDPLRYFFLREVPFGQDGNYSHEAIVTRVNADLANGLGNLAQRSLSIIARNCEGLVPTPSILKPRDRGMLHAADSMVYAARSVMETQQLHRVLHLISALVADANGYFASEAPWALSKTDPARMRTVLYVTAELIRQIAILAQPFMPTSSGKLLDLLGVSANKHDREFSALEGGQFLTRALGAENAKPQNIARIVGGIRRRNHGARIVLQGSWNFATEAVMKWCDGNGVDYVFNLRGNNDLVTITKRGQLSRKHRSKRTRRNSVRFFDLDWKLRNWSRERRVVAKRAITGRQVTARFVVTSLNRAEVLSQALFDKNIQKRIKGRISVGRKLPAPTPVFPRYVEAEVGRAS
jgi:methionyl-tRNA synthetase